MTIPDVLRLIKEQTKSQFMVSDFVPVTCFFPTCNSVTYAYVDEHDGSVTPMTRLLEVDDYLDYITNRAVPDLADEIKKVIEGL